MDLAPWLLGAGTVLVTQALTLVGDGLRRRWAEADEDRRRLRERTDEAANRLLDLMDHGRDAYKMDRETDQEAVYALCHRIDREAELLKDPTARSSLKAVSTALWHADTGMFEVPARSVAYMSVNEGRDVLGALLRGEPIGEVPPNLRVFDATVHEAYAGMDE